MIGTKGGIGAGKKWISFDIEVTGEKQVQRFIQNFGLRSKDMRPPLMDFAKYILKRFADRFKKETGRTKWQPLAESTVLARTKHWGGYRQPSSQGPRHMILQWTGGLMRSFSVQGAEGNVFRVTPSSLEIGSSLKTAAYHHGPKKTKMPQRRVAFLDEKDNYELIKYFHKAMETNIREARRRV